MSNTDSQDYADFQAWKAAKADRDAAELASRISFPQVLHNIIDRIGFHTTQERDAAHAAVEREYPTTEDANAPPAPPVVVPDNRNADQGYTPLTTGDGS